MNCGVYKITSPTGKFYVGSSVDLLKRKNTHFSHLKNGKHHNINLQRAFKKYGVENLKFEIILYCSKNNLLFYEQLILSNFKPRYNCAKVAGSPMANRKHTYETKQKMIQARIKNNSSEKQRYAMLGKSHPSTDEINQKNKVSSK